jgi:hypothetical protein
MANHDEFALAINPEMDPKALWGLLSNLHVRRDINLLALPGVRPQVHEALGSLCSLGLRERDIETSLGEKLRSD